MRRPHPLPGLLLLAATMLLAACRDAAPARTPPVPSPAPPAPRPAAWDAARGTAILRGVVRFAGPRPTRADLGDGEEHREWERLEVNDDGTLPHAFVRAVEGPSLGLTGYAGADVEVDQAGMRFVPHVAGVLVGGEVRFRNSDPCVHNVHVIHPALDRWNPTQPPGTESAFRPARAAHAVRIVCDLHSWMCFWLHVCDHPFFSVTARGTGAYEIRGLYPGRHRFRVWHETWAKDAAAEFEADLAPGPNVRDVEVGAEK